MQGRESNWDYLANSAEFDIALLQEATYPTGYSDQFATVIHHSKKKRAWGSAIVSRHLKLTEYKNLNYGYWGYKLNGSIVVAQDENQIWFASIHARQGALNARDLMRNPLPGISSKDKNQIQEITIIQQLLTRHLAGKTFIVAGDFNATYSRDEQVFENFAKVGFSDTRIKFFDLPQQTYFKRNSKPSALDHIFTDKSTYEKLIKWQVQVEVACDAELSDHAPILTEYEFS